MKRFYERDNYHPIPEVHLNYIHGGGGWIDKVIWFVINNWDDIKNGLKDGFNAYQEKH